MKNLRISQSSLFMHVFVLAVALTFSSANLVLSQPDISRGVEAFENRNYYGAERFFTDYTAVNTEDPEGWYYLGRVKMEKGENKVAIDYFEKAIDLDQENSLYFTWGGINYIHLLSKVNFMEQGLYAYRALNTLEKAVELDPDNLEARIWLAGYYANAPSFAGGSESDAKDQLAEIFKRDPDHIGGLLQQGEIMSVFGEYEASMKSYDRIVELDPEFFPVYLSIGRLVSQSGMNTGKGIKALVHFINESPAEFDHVRDDAWYLLGNIYEKEGKLSEARQSYEKAVSLNPDEEEYQKSLKKTM